MPELIGLATFSGGGLVSGERANLRHGFQFF
jgi:hypothetical protein